MQWAPGERQGRSASALVPYNATLPALSPSHRRSTDARESATLCVPICYGSLPRGPAPSSSRLHRDANPGARGTGGAPCRPMLRGVGARGGRAQSIRNGTEERFCGEHPRQRLEHLTQQQSYGVTDCDAKARRGGDSSERERSTRWVHKCGSEYLDEAHRLGVRSDAG
eukprot:scaffold122101_cov34-Tisochrysis_lutea.AAC.1